MLCAWEGGKWLTIETKILGTLCVREEFDGEMEGGDPTFDG